MSASDRQKLEALLERYYVALKDSISNNEIDPEELELAETSAQAMAIGIGLIQEFIATLKIEDMRAAIRLEKSLYILLRGVVGCSGLIVSSKTSKSITSKVALSELTARGRKKSAENRSSRDKTLTNVLGPLIERGIKGEKLKDALVEAFKRDGVEAAKAKPSVRRVQLWVKEYKEEGKWRAPAKS